MLKDGGSEWVLEKKKKRMDAGGTNKSPDTASQRPLRAEGGGEVTTKGKWREGAENMDQLGQIM